MKTLTLQSLTSLTHDTKRFIFKKPSGFTFQPGHAMRLALPAQPDASRPFTLTSSSDDPYLEFVIKQYSDHTPGITKQLHQLQPGDHVLITKEFQTYQYTKPGIFIAGGTGITPFIAILRDLKKKNQLEGNTLLFSNKSEKDIILHDELADLPIKKIFTLTREENHSYEKGRIDLDFLKKHLSEEDWKKPFYICGSKQMVVDLREALENQTEIQEIVVE